ncbi:DNA mismatch repair mutS [Gossypium australe]|uniref:DNA mismatch repair mutS n=1 Tax=Gossypium australe TaxID=47621 RepID=A0A5B6UM38_9ROSI|nr:DNA mismatch repair mutS [Gossypium australe]
MACLSLCLPEGEFDELLEHVPLSTRRKLLLSPTVPFENQVETSSCLMILFFSGYWTIFFFLAIVYLGKITVLRLVCPSKLEFFQDSGSRHVVVITYDISLELRSMEQNEAQRVTGKWNFLVHLGPLSLPPCSARDQVDQHLAKDSPNYKVTSGAIEVATNKDPLDSAAFSQDSQQASSCHDVVLPINVYSERHQADELTGTEANADASGLQINAGVFLPPNPVPSNVPGVIKVDCADKMLPSLSKDNANSSATTGVIASCLDVDFPINGNSQGSESDHLKGNQADASEQEKINFDVHLSSDVSSIEKVDSADNMLLSLSNEDTNNSASTGVTRVNMMDKKLSDFTFGELDHIVLKERRKLLLKRKFMELEKPAVKSSGHAHYMVVLIHG